MAGRTAAVIRPRRQPARGPADERKRLAGLAPPAADRAAPLHHQLKESLAQQIVSGRRAAGSELPSENELCRHFAVSRGTLRRALADLAQQGLVDRRQGRGTFVATHDPRRLIFHFFHIVPRAGGSVYPDTKRLDFSRDRATAAEAARLGLAAGDAVWRIRNLLSLEGAPALVDDITLARERFPDLTAKIYERRENTIYNLYQSRYGLNVLRTTERLRAVLADAATAKLLAVKRGAPILEIDRVALTYHDAPVELRRSRVDTTRYDYLSDLGKGDHVRKA